MAILQSTVASGLERGGGLGLQPRHNRQMIHARHANRIVPRRFIQVQRGREKKHTQEPETYKENGGKTIPRRQPAPCRLLSRSDREGQGGRRCFRSSLRYSRKVARPSPLSFFPSTRIDSACRCEATKAITARTRTRAEQRIARAAVARRVGVTDRRGGEDSLR